ncbi:type III PLP-dependent enzyme [Pseudoalteromonas sp. YIC-827]|uniref:Type III PLP-dependent enzyme n=1 Tax=Pseudoalteromonas qingdaonensis TaxID=3131913 RepID=A0ABU9MWG0_9GAMM
MMSVSTLAQPFATNNEHLSLCTALAKQHGTPLLVLDLNQVRENYLQLANALPNVALHYALKPLPHIDVVHTLNELGGSFDLATNGEVDLVAQAGVAPSQVIHTHPIKRVSDIEHALSYGCTTFVFDSENELHKFVPYRDQVELLLRLSFPNKDAAADLSKKFGVIRADALPLLKRAKELGIRVRGLSFHVGSQTMDAGKYVHAIEQCKIVFEGAVAEGLGAMNTLDIGGGFPVSYSGQPIDIFEFCAPIRDALSSWPDTVQFIAEPGRFIVASAMTHVMSVMGQSKRGGTTWYYMDDGVYGAFSGRVYGEPDQRFYSLAHEDVQPCVLTGPTCDSIDVISDNCLMPALADGDLVFTENMGAYTWTTSTEFNFFAKATLISLQPSLMVAQVG